MLADGWMRELRLAAGLSLASVGERMGVSAACVSRWETGRRRPTAAKQAEFARACGKGWMW